MVWHAIPITRPDVRADDNKMRAINFPSDVAKYEVLNLRATWPHVPTPCCYMGPWGWGHLTEFSKRYNARKRTGKLSISRPLSFLSSLCLPFTVAFCNTGWGVVTCYSESADDFTRDISSFQAIRGLQLQSETGISTILDILTREILTLTNKLLFF
jgi:hypothetical protein